MTAHTLAQSILNRLEEADEDLGRFIKITGWLACGYSTFTEWWEADAVPVIQNLMYLDVRLKPAVLNIVVKQLDKEDKELPSAQRRGQRGIASIVGSSQKTVSRSTSESRDSDVDLPRRSNVDWNKAEKLIRKGESFGEVARQLGVNESVIRRDMAVRQARAEVDPEFDIQGESIRHYDKTVACDLEPAKKAIDEVDMLLGRITKVYTLSKKDQTKLVQVLRSYLERFEA